jgi:carboxypeptidase family protein
LRFLVSTLAMVLSVLPLTEGAAQTNTGEIQGTVKDPLGGVLSGATVVIVHVASGLRVERTSDDNGRFSAPALPVGEYTVTVTLEGFKVATRSELVLQVGQRLDLPITLTGPRALPSQV